MRIKILTGAIALILFVSMGALVTNAISSSKSRLNLFKNNDVSITITTPDLKTEITNQKTGKTLTLNSTSAQVMSNGDILYMGKDYSLRKVSSDGKNEVILIPEERVNAPIYLNAEETLVAFTEARDFEGSPYPVTNGVAVYDLKTGEIKTLIIEKGKLISNYGWVGEKLLVGLPGGNKFEPKVLDLESNVRPFEKAPSLPLIKKWPKRSFDGKFLAYESYEDNAVVLNLETGAVKKFDKASSPQWTDQGLQFMEGNSPKTVMIQ